MVYCSWLFVYSKTRTERLLHAFPNLEIYLYENGETGTILYKNLMANYSIGKQEHKRNRLVKFEWNRTKLRKLWIFGSGHRHRGSSNWLNRWSLCNVVVENFNIHFYMYQHTTWQKLQFFKNIWLERGYLFRWPIIIYYQ